MQIMDSHMRAALEMPPEEGQRFLRALAAYVADGEAPDFSAPEDWPLKALWTAIEPVLETSKDISAKRSRAGRRGAEARCGGDAREPGAEEGAGEAGMGKPEAKASGREASAGKPQASASKREANASKPEAKASKPVANASKPQANASGREEEGEREVKSKGQERGRAQARFSPPTAAEVAAYASEAGLRMDAQAFVDFYASKGWRVGRDPMRDWRAAARNWARRDREGPGGKVVPFGGPRARQAEVSADVLAAYL